MTVHVIATGGTITSHHDGTSWTNVDGATLIRELGPLPVDVVVREVAAGPSSNLSVDDMVAVAVHVRHALDAGAQGVVVVHGTDTMELTAFVTQLMLGTTDDRRPVVFTGSMRVHSHPAPDGPDNLRRAIAVAADEAAVGRDVMVCVEGAVHAADRVRKRHAASVDAFDSAPFEPIGRVAGPHGPVSFVRAGAARRPAAGVAGPVPMVTCYPGIAADVFDGALGDARGIVVDGFGDLNLPRSLWMPVHAAWNAGVLVVVASPAFTPGVGDDDLRALGAVGAGGLPAQKARLAVMAALATTSDRDAAVSFVHQYALEFDAGDRSTTP